MESLNRESRLKDLEKLHAKGKITRVKVNTKGGDLKEIINGTWKTFKAGEVFEHPAPARVEQLMELGLVQLTSEKTNAEKASEKAEDDEAIKAIMEEQREKAKKILADRKGKLDKLEATLRKMTPDVLAKELKERKLEAGPSVEDQIKVILAAELEELKAKG